MQPDAHLDSNKQMNRRQFKARVTASGFGLAIAQHFSQDILQAQPDVPASRNRFPRMVQEYYVRRVQAILDYRERRIDQLKTRDDALKYVEEVRKRIRRSFGTFPEKTELKPQVTKVIERDGYTISNVIFESRPGFLVTGNLYKPTTGKGPYPGVIGTCGHSTNGKANEAYQSFSQGLVRQGYIVFIYDPIGQGERLQYTDDELKSKVGVGVREHLMAGNQQFLIGEFFGSWRAWDGIRALDYLLTDPDVDPERIGVTGNSGGGTMTTWLAGVENRWTMAAPSCFVTSLMNNLENELPADTEQCPPGILGSGLDHEDFLVALAPKPVIILAKEKDFFDVRGSEAAIKRLKHIYGLLGADENVELFVGPTPHGFSQENREAMYGWFNQASKLGDNTTEPKLTIEEDETLYCAPRGQVATLNSRTVMQFTRQRSRELARRRRPLTLERAQQYLRTLLQARRVNESPEYRILRPHSDNAYPRKHASTYMVETDPSIFAIVYRLAEERLQSRPPRSDKPAVLYLSHQSADQDLKNETWVKAAYEQHPDADWYACDVRGIGESLPNTCGQDTFLNAYGCDYFYAAHGIMLADPYPGQKTRDVMAVLNWLRSNGHQKIHVAACGWGTLAATFASILDNDVASLQLHRPLESYASIAEAETYEWPLSTFVPHILRFFDLPDLYELLKSRGLVMTDPQGP